MAPPARGPAELAAVAPGVFDELPQCNGCGLCAQEFLAGSDGDGAGDDLSVLVLNAGSSSLKHALLDVDTGRILTEGTVRWPADEAGGRHEAAARDAVSGLPSAPDAVGRRVVHGGGRFTAPTRIGPAELDQIRALGALAPLHNPAAAAGIAAAHDALPGVPQVACFDTAFHHTLPPAATTYALPAAWRDAGGFAGMAFTGSTSSGARDRHLTVWAPSARATGRWSATSGAAAR